MKFAKKYNAASKFLLLLLSLEEKLKLLLKRNDKIENLSKEEKSEIRKTKNCSHCHEPFLGKDDMKGWPVNDHVRHSRTKILFRVTYMLFYLFFII